MQIVLKNIPQIIDITKNIIKPRKKLKILNSL